MAISYTSNRFTYPVVERIKVLVRSNEVVRLPALRRRHRVAATLVRSQDLLAERREVGRLHKLVRHRIVLCRHPLLEQLAHVPLVADLLHALGDGTAELQLVHEPFFLISRKIN